MRKVTLLISGLALGALMAGSAMAQTSESTGVQTNNPNQVVSHSSMQRPNQGNYIQALIKATGATAEDKEAITQYTKDAASIAQVYRTSIQTALQVTRNPNATDADYAAAAATISSNRATYLSRTQTLQTTLLSKLSDRGKVAFFASENMRAGGNQNRFNPQNRKQNNQNTPKYQDNQNGQIKRGYQPNSNTEQTNDQANQ